LRCGLRAFFPIFPNKKEVKHMWFVIAIILIVLGVIVWATTRKTRFGHLARVVAMFMTGGFAFPHVLTEGDDAKHEADKGAKVPKQ
jgi:hypothetical protein